MRKSTHTRPALEPLEEKALLSHVVPHHPVHLARVTPSLNRPVTIKTNQLQGMVTGTYAIAPSTSAPGMNYNLNGSGQVGTLGDVQVTGFIHVGTNPKSAPTGTITLSDGKGSIQLTITGKGGPRPLAPVGSGAMSLHYTIVSGTGAFRNYHGSGSVNMATLPITPVVTPPVTPPNTTPAGRRRRRISDHATGDPTGHAATGHHTAGHDAAGHDPAGHDAAGYDTAGHDAAGHNPAGHDAAGHDAAGHDAPGHNAAGDHATGHAPDFAAGDPADTMPPVTPARWCRRRITGPQRSH